MSDEEVLYDEPGAKVTTKRAVIGGATYPVSGITSVKSTRKAPSLMPLFVGGFLALVCIPVALFAFSQATQGNNVGLLGGVVMFVVGLGGAGLAASPFLAKTSHRVVIGTAEGSKTALTTTDREVAEAIRAAVEEAIVRRD